jgi:hypothetical protein
MQTQINLPRRISLLLFSLWVAPLMVLNGQATTAMAQGASDNMAIVREKVLADRKFFVASNLELNEQESKAFWPVYDRYVQDVEKLGARMGAIIDDFANNYEAMTEAKSKSLLDDYMTLEAERLALRQTYLPKFREVIPEKKVTRYYQVESKISAVINFEMARRIPLMK